MKRSSSFGKSPREDAQKTEEKYKAFDDICKYFSKEEWEKLGDSQKRTYVYMKRNYDAMTHLGVMTNLPVFMRPKKQTTKPPENDSDEDQNCGNHDEGPQEASKVQQREHAKVMAKKPAREENDFKSLLMTPGSEPAQEELCPLKKVSAAGKKSKKMPEVSARKKKVRAHGVQRKKFLLVNEDISDTK